MDKIDDDAKSDRSTVSSKSSFKDTKKQFSSQLNDINHTVNDLSKQVKNAEYRAEMAEKESESRKETIDKLKDLNKRSVDDLNNANSQLSMRNQQINSLKDTVKDLQQQLKDLQSEKTSTQMQHDNFQDTITQKSNEIDRLKRELEASMDDLTQHPSFLELQNEKTKLKKEIEIEKEGRIAALSAWQKMEKKMKDFEGKFAEKESQYLRDLKELRLKSEESLQKLVWAEQKLDASRDGAKTMESDYKMIQEENVNLKIRINSMETEIRSQAQIEQMKSKNLIENAMTEMKWREHLLIQQLEKFKHDLNREQVQKLKYQKAVRTLEVEIANNQNVMSNDNGNKNAIVKRKFTELNELDAEINKLRREIRNESNQAVRPEKWIRNPPPPQFLQSPMQNPMGMQNQMGMQSPMQQPVQQGLQSPMPNMNNGGIYYGAPNQMNNNNQMQQQPKHIRQSSYHSPLAQGGNMAMQQRASSLHRQQQQNNGRYNPKKQKQKRITGQLPSASPLLSPGGLFNPSHDADNFWADLQDPQPMSLNNLSKKFANNGYPESDAQYARQSYNQQNANGYGSKRRRRRPAQASSDKPVRAKRRIRKKTKSDTAEKPRWR